MTLSRITVSISPTSRHFFPSEVNTILPAEKTIITANSSNPVTITPYLARTTNLFFCLLILFLQCNPYLQQLICQYDRRAHWQFSIRGPPPPPSAQFLLADSPP